jgi:hypothetical protein
MRTMTVGQLRELLEDYPDEAEVRMACQPSWPFEYSIAGVVALSEMKERGDEDGSDFDDRHPSTGINPKPDEVVFIVEGRQLSYGTKLLWDMVA